MVSQDLTQSEAMQFPFCFKPKGSINQEFLYHSALILAVYQFKMTAVLRQLLTFWLCELLVMYITTDVL